MVSSTLNLREVELRKALRRIKREHADDPEYKRLRKELPKDWPL